MTTSIIDVMWWWWWCALYCIILVLLVEKKKVEVSTFSFFFSFFARESKNNHKEYFWSKPAGNMNASIFFDWEACVQKPCSLKQRRRKKKMYLKRNLTRLNFKKFKTLFIFCKKNFKYAILHNYSFIHKGFSYYKRVIMYKTSLPA